MKICDEIKCMGCGVCVDVCLGDCVSIFYSDNGFFQSRVDEEKCVGCNQCVKVCPANNPNKPYRIMQAFKARRTDALAAKESTSGGIAAALSEYFVDNGGVVVGCGFDSKFNLKHSLAFDRTDIERFKGSKYLQSNTVGIYKAVKDQLKQDKTVLFIGSPCQVAALRNFLKKDYRNLFLVDFVCHGVSSYLAFEKFVDSLNQSASPLSIKFRNKDNGYKDKKSAFSLKIEYPDAVFSNGTDKGFYYWFASSLIIRESCYKCPFVSVERVSDLTIADYVGSDLNATDDRIGVSTVFINTEKGVHMMQMVQFDIVSELMDTIETEKKYSRLIVDSYRPKCRDDFFTALRCTDYSVLEKKYTADIVSPGKFESIFRSLKRKLHGNKH